MAMIDHIRQIRAQQNFKILNELEVTGFEDSSEDLKESGDESEEPQIDIWASVKLKTEGTVPESYRILNAIIGDWIEENEAKITKAIHPKLISFLKEKYPDLDLEAIEKGFEDSPVWEDQLDYMPRISKDGNTMEVEIELVIEHETVEE